MLALLAIQCLGLRHVGFEGIVRRAARLSPSGSPSGERAEADRAGEGGEPGGEACRAEHSDEDRSACVAELAAGLAGTHGLTQAAGGAAAARVANPMGVLIATPTPTPISIAAMAMPSHSRGESDRRRDARLPRQA
jgi:hypothetical protein